MKLKNIVFVISIILLLGCGEKETTKYYSNGSIMEKYKVKNNSDIINGEYKMYSPEGNIIVSKQYIDGIEDGSYTYYYDTNKVILEIGNFKQGKLNGIIQHFYYNGSIRYKLEYKDGKIWNILILKSIDGLNLNSGNFKNGNGLLFKYDEEGHLVKKYNITNGFKNGWQYSYSNTGFIDSFLYENNIYLDMKIFDNSY